jgi:hypothetical protein
VTQAERATLVKLGEEVGSAIKEPITIVHTRTFSRWISEKKSAKDKAQKARGRPRKPEEVRQIVVELAKDRRSENSSDNQSIPGYHFSAFS